MPWEAAFNNGIFIIQVESLSMAEEELEEEAVLRGLSALTLNLTVLFIGAGKITSPDAPVRFQVVFSLSHFHLP